MKALVVVAIVLTMLVTIGCVKDKPVVPAQEPQPVITPISLTDTTLRPTEPNLPVQSWESQHPPTPEPTYPVVPPTQPTPPTVSSTPYYGGYYYYVPPTPPKPVSTAWTGTLPVVVTNP